MINVIARVEVYVFYFDLIGFVAQYRQAADDTLTRLRVFQREARDAFSFSTPHSYVVTLYDNVWCRVNVSQAGMPSLLMDFAGTVMSAAIAHGFPTYFGSITKGVHEFDRVDRVIEGKQDFEDLTVQHVDMTSEPHIRAALAEKWFKRRSTQSSCVWVSSEVATTKEVSLESEYSTSSYVPSGEAVDLRDIESEHGAWPFTSSVFSPIGPRAVNGV